MAFDEWYQKNEIEVKSLLYEAYHNGRKAGIEEAKVANRSLANWVADFYLFGIFWVGDFVVGPGCSCGEAWAIARQRVKRWVRPFFGIDIHS